MRKSSETENAAELNALGKNLLNDLESEFFTLEEKNLDTISQALTKTVEQVPTDIDISFTLAFIQPNEPDAILYALVYGNGTIAIKRGDKIGTIVSGNSRTVISSSGYLEDDDVVILQTPEFSELIHRDDLKNTIGEKPVQEAAELLTPKIHQMEHADGAGAVLISYAKPLTEQPLVAPMPKTEESHEHIEEPLEHQPEDSPPMETVQETEPSHDFLMDELSEQKPSRSFFSSFTHSKMLFLTIAIIVGIVLAVSIFFALKKQQDQKNQALFDQVYPPAEQKYEEGQTLMSLNQSLARDDFTKAQQMLSDAKQKFPKDSSQEKQINDLLAKVQAGLDQTANKSQAAATEVSGNPSPLLSYEKANSKSAYTQDDKSIIAIDTTSVTSTDKSSNKTSTLFKNSNDWKDAAGIGTYLGNIYVLDRSSTILKFASGSYTKSNYLTSSFDLSKGQSMTIDGSIYVLLSTGDVVRFTRGKVDPIKVSGLDQPLNNPTKIFTSADMTNIYILDNGNSRLIVLNKDGAFQAQYQTGIFKDAKDIDVDEKGKKAYILSGGKIYQIDLK